MSLQAFPIVGLTKGLQTNVKPAMLPDQAFAILQNAYTWRERELKREGRQNLGRLKRVFINVSLFNTGSSPYTVNLLNVSGYITAITKASSAVVTTSAPHDLTTGDEVVFSQVEGMVEINGGIGTVTVSTATVFSVNIDSSGYNTYTGGGFFFSNRALTDTIPNAEIVPGSVVYTINTMTPIVFYDVGNGILTSPTMGNSGWINYITGVVTITTTATSDVSTTAIFSYYPTLPVMGMPQRALAGINENETVFFDTTYAYDWDGSGFTEFIPGTTWNGSDSQFFWAFNYQGASSSDRVMFVTNGFADPGSPMAYTDGNTWTTFAPAVTSSTSMFSSLILIAYYGRMIALNTYENTTSSGASGSTNYFNRCRFSALGDPTASDAWRSDMFGQGGLIDAPVNEAITGATFVKNTLLVDFENSTWQLRYVGEYGLPFIWERVSADFGSDSTFSGVLFDNYRLSVGNRAIIRGTSNGVERIDLDIPDNVFEFQEQNEGLSRVYGIRNYQKEIVYWSYVDSNYEASNSQPLTYPNKVLLFNYRNNTWAIFDDSVTCFGKFQSVMNGITWSNLNVFWSSTEVTWDNIDEQPNYEFIVAGNQQGFISIYCDESPGGQSMVDANDQESLTIQGISVSNGILQVYSTNHNLQQGDTIYITGLQFLNSTTNLPVATNLNNQIYNVLWVPTDDDGNVNYFLLQKWNFTTNAYETNFSYTPAGLTGVTYIGGGYISVFPKLNILTKDINLFQGQSLQTKMSRIDFLCEPVNPIVNDGQTQEVAIAVNLYLNASTDGSTPGVVSGNKLVGNKYLSLNPTPPFYTPGSQYNWFRFYATLAAQYFSINITYDDTLMNQLATHQSSFVLYGINAWCRPGGKNVF